MAIAFVIGDRLGGRQIGLRSALLLISNRDSLALHWGLVTELRATVVVSTAAVVR